jgi:hypothetical protein
VPLLAAGLAGSLAAAALVSLAPGNDVRRAQLPPPLPVSESISHAIADARVYLIDSFEKPEVLLISLTALILTLAATTGGRHLAKPDPTTLGIAFFGGLFAAFLLVAACIAPSYYVTNFPPPPRALTPAVFTVIGFALFIGCLAGLFLRSIAGERLDAWMRPDVRLAVLVPPLVLALIALAVALPPAIDRFGDRHELSAYGAEWDRRDRQIRDAKRSGQEDVTTRALPHRGRFVEITSDPRTWINDCMASYYGVKSIRAQ